MRWLTSSITVMCSGNLIKNDKFENNSDVITSYKRSDSLLPDLQRRQDVNCKKHAIKVIKKTKMESPTLYMNHLYRGLTVSDLREIFSFYGEVTEIDKSDYWASIRFQKPDDAMRSLQNVKRKNLGKENFEISDRELLQPCVRKPLVKSASSSRSGVYNQRQWVQRPWNAGNGNETPKYEDLVKLFRRRRTNFIHLKKRLVNEDT